MRPIRKLSLGRVTTVWGVLFAIVHTYWASGGAAGMDGEPADTLAAQLYIGFIAVLGLAGMLLSMLGWFGRRVSG
jgi:hypothetical protein